MIHFLLFVEPPSSGAAGRGIVSETLFTLQRLVDRVFMRQQGLLPGHKRIE